jgi:peptidase E
MSSPILNKNKSSRLEIGEIVAYFKNSNDDIRYTVKFNRTSFDCIPLVHVLPLIEGDRVIILFQDSNIKDTPFIVGKFNQKSKVNTKFVSTSKEIKRPNDDRGVKQETDYSFIKMDSTRKKITIGNKNTNKGNIVIDNDEVFIGGVNLSKLIENINSKSQSSLSNETVSAKKDYIIEAEGKIIGRSSEITFLTSNFLIENSHDMQITTPHLNFSSSFIEFNVITPKGYDLKQKNAYSFFGVDGNFSIALGLGDFKLKTFSATSKICFLISPKYNGDTPALKKFENVDNAVAGLTIENTKAQIGNLNGSSRITIDQSSFEAKVLSTSYIKMNPEKFSVELNDGLVKMELSSSKFKVSIASNSITLDSSGFQVKSGNIQSRFFPLFTYSTVLFNSFFI